jgi:hypothetical protein
VNPLPSIVLSLLLAGAAVPQEAPPPGLSKLGDTATGNAAQIRFTYENPQSQPVKYVLLLRENGDGSYRSEIGSGETGEELLQAQPLDREIQVSNAARAKIFVAARRGKYFDIRCEVAGEKVAFQGTKTLEYSGEDGHGNCTYNWTKNNNIQYLTDTFEGISLTLEEGSRLEVEYRHRRLALDSELETLEELAGQGRALELQNIAPVLNAIAGDDQVLKRDQRMARTLLAMAGSK